MGKISIVIISYNRPNDLLELLIDISCFDNTKELLDEVIILNNNSTENYSLVRNFITETPHVPWNYIDLDENLGVSRGRNKGMQMAKGEFLMIVDDDVLLKDTKTLLKIKSFYESEFALINNVGVFTPLIIYKETNQIQQSAFPHKKFNKYFQQPEFLTSYFIGATHIIKNEVLQKTGYLPEDFFYGMEEYDLSYRIIIAGYSLAFTNTIKVLHKESVKGRLPKKEKLFMMWQNKSKVARRYLPIIYFFSTFFSWSFFYLKNSRFHWKGWITGITRLPSLMKINSSVKLPKHFKSYLKKTEARLYF